MREERGGERNPLPPFPNSPQSHTLGALLYSSQAVSVPRSKMAAGIQHVLTNAPALQASFMIAYRRPSSGDLARITNTQRTLLALFSFKSKTV